jgi:hypothetical protein
MARKLAGCKQAGENSAARHSSGHTARTLPRFDRRNETGGRQAHRWVGGDLATHTAIVLSLHALGLVPRVEGRPHFALPWFDKLTTGLEYPVRGCGESGLTRAASHAPTYFDVVVGFLAVAVAGGVAGFEAITGVSVPPASTERQSAGS